MAVGWPQEGEKLVQVPELSAAVAWLPVALPEQPAAQLRVPEPMALELSAFVPVGELLPLVESSGQQAQVCLAPLVIV